MHVLHINLFPTASLVPYRKHWWSFVTDTTYFLRQLRHPVFTSNIIAPSKEQNPFKFKKRK